MTTIHSFSTQLNRMGLRTRIVSPRFQGATPHQGTQDDSADSVEFSNSHHRIAATIKHLQDAITRAKSSPDIPSATVESLYQDLIPKVLEHSPEDVQRKVLDEYLDFRRKHPEVEGRSTTPLKEVLRGLHKAHWGRMEDLENKALTMRELLDVRRGEPTPQQYAQAEALGRELLEGDAIEKHGVGITGRDFVLEDTGLACLEQGKFEEAFSLFQQCLELRCRKFAEAHGPANRDYVLQAISAPLEPAQRFIEQIQQDLNERSPRTHTESTEYGTATITGILNTLTYAHLKKGDVDEALRYRQARALVSACLDGWINDSPIYNLDSLALTYLEAGKEDEAMPIIEQSLDLQNQLAKFNERTQQGDRGYPLCHPELMTHYFEYKKQRREPIPSYAVELLKERFLSPGFETTQGHDNLIELAKTAEQFAKMPNQTDEARRFLRLAAQECRRVARRFQERNDG